MAPKVVLTDYGFPELEIEEPMLAEAGAAFVTGGSFARELIADGDQFIARYVRVYAEGIRQCPQWHPGDGGPAWVFIDEIRVNPE